MKGRFSKIRLVVQVLFFLFVAGLAVWGAGDLHSICPFGAAETAGRLLTQGLFVPKTSLQNLVVFGALALLTIMFGAAFCGWLCPLGSIQGWVGRLGKKIFGRGYNHFVPPKLDRILGFLRYGVLALVIFKTTEMVTLAFVAVDPFYALFNFYTGNALPSALAVLGVVLVASLFVERPWCRWLCPLGALTGLLQKLSPWKIRMREDCTECGRCVNACPVNIDVCAKPAVTDSRCIRCMECLGACNKSAIAFSLPKGKAALNRPVLTGLLVLSGLLLPMAGFKLADIVAGVLAGNDSTLMTPGEITPKMTIAELALGYRTDAAVIMEFLGIPAGTPDSTRLVDLEDIDSGLTLKNIRAALEKYPGPLEHP